jgi:hexosaminidase
MRGYRSVVWILCGLAVLAGCQTSGPAPGSPAKAEAESVSAAQPLAADAAEWILLPQPRQMEVTGTFEGPGTIVIEAPGISDRLVSLYEETVLHDTYSVTTGTSAVTHASSLLLNVDPARMPHPQGYELVIEPATLGGTFMTVTAHDEAGLFYAYQTLKQLLQQAQRHDGWPVCRVVDWPDFPNRGVMIDVARDKVPEMKTLYELVDMLASWKYNQLQLYTEHTFAYDGHHVVWEDASPMTPVQIRDLDAYCKERFIQLVPNQNSFGHMGRWLQHPEYADLAETPNGGDLCPVDPRSIELLRSMYTFMLPNFSSPFFNVGCDETWSLGKGRSKAAVEQKGVGRVYLDFLLQIHELVRQNGKRMQFWADIINNHPELIPELPKDVVAMEWGYDAGHPYPEHTKRFRDNGVAFYVVPGTSSWNSLLGRTDNALANLREAAQYGRDNGGEGFLVTDWGDGGHWQFLPVSYLPYAYGAGLSWCYDTNRDMDVARAADLYAFRDAAGVMGRAAYDLGNAYKQTGLEFGNNTTFYMLLQHRVESPLSEGGLERLKAEDLEKTIAYIDEALARMNAADMDRPDAELIREEFRMNAAMAKLACRVGTARVRAGGVPTSALPKDVRAGLAAELEALLPGYRQLWLARNRSGGLKDSAGRLEGLLEILRR